MATKTDAKTGGTREAKKELTDAKNLDGKLRAMTARVNDNLTEWMYLIADARRTNIHTKVLDANGKSFPTWQAYITNVLSDAPMFHAVVRAPIAEMLRGEGLSIPAIAEILGVSNGTAWNDLNRPKAKDSSPNKNVAQTPADIATKRIETATKDLSKNAEKMPTRDRTRVRKETMSMLAAVASPYEQLVEVLTMVRANVDKSEVVSTKDLERMQVALKAAEADVDKALVTRKAGRSAHPAGKRRGTQSRTGAANAA